MNSTQIAFDFAIDASEHPEKCDSPIFRPAKTSVASVEAEHIWNEAYWKKWRAEARAYWKVGMVTSLPCFATVQDSTQCYTQMLPGVIESIDGDISTVRIYAAPEYGYILENYPLHRKLAINVQLVDLCVHHGEDELARVVEDGLLETGDPELAVRVRERQNFRRAA